MKTSSPLCSSDLYKFNLKQITDEWLQVSVLNQKRLKSFGYFLGLNELEKRQNFNNTFSSNFQSNRKWFLLLTPKARHLYLTKGTQNVMNESRNVMIGWLVWSVTSIIKQKIMWHFVILGRPSRKMLMPPSTLLLWKNLCDCEDYG